MVAGGWGSHADAAAAAAGNWRRGGIAGSTDRRCGSRQPRAAASKRGMPPRGHTLTHRPPKLSFNVVQREAATELVCVDVVVSFVQENEPVLESRRTWWSVSRTGSRRFGVAIAPRSNYIASSPGSLCDPRERLGVFFFFFRLSAKMCVGVRGDSYGEGKEL